MDVSIILVNYNTNGLLIDCVQSICLQTKHVSFEIIIVDNNSNDFCPQDFTSLYKNIKVIQLDLNIGFGRANNEGLKIAQGDYIFFLNSDTILLNDAVSILCNYLKDHISVGICGGNLYTREKKPNMSYTQSFPRAVDYIKLLMRFRSGSLEDDLFNETGQNMKIGGYISGADLMIRKELLEKYGGFDPRFFMYFEDVELCYRIKRKGFEIHSVPSAKIIHLQGASSVLKGESLKVKSHCHLVKSQFLYFKITDSDIVIQFLWFSYLLKSILALFFYKIIGEKSRIIYWKSNISILKEIYGEKNV